MPSSKEVTSIIGSVRDEAGKPVAGAIVRAQENQDAPPAAEARSDDHGQYQLTGLKQGATYGLWLVLAGVRRQAAVLTLETSTTRYDIQLPLGETMPTETTTTTTVTSDTTTTGTSTDSTTDSTTITDSTTSTDSTTDSTTTATASTDTTTTTIAPPVDPFDAFISKLRQPEFQSVPPVSIEEANEFRRLYTVGLYVIAGVPAALQRLRASINNDQVLPAGVTLRNRSALFDRYDASLDGIVTYANTVIQTDPQKTNEQFLRDEIRREFNIGNGSAAAGANGQFAGLFRNFVSLCADDLMGVDPDSVKPGAAGTVVVDARQYESVLSFLRRVKHATLDLVQNMSVYGTVGTRRKVADWVGHMNMALDILVDVGTNHIGSDDIDDRHFLSVLSAFAGVDRSEVKAYMDHAADGGALLGYAITLYSRIKDDRKLESEEGDYLRTLFYQDGYVFQNPNRVAARVLKERAAIVRDNWLPRWG